MKKLLPVILSLIFFGLIGCKSTDPAWQAERDLERNEIEASELNKEELDKVTYLAKNLLGGKDRAKLKSRLLEEARNWDYTNQAIGFVGSSALTSNPFSTSGVKTAATLSMAMDAVDFIFDGSADDIAQAFFPETDEQGNVMTLEQADMFARKKANQAAIETYKEYGIDLKCIAFCDVDDERRFYRADITQSEVDALKLKYGYKYVPSTFQLIINITGLLEVKNADKLRQLALGFKPKFISGYNHFKFVPYADLYLDENGKEEVTEFEGNPKNLFYSAKRKMVGTQFGRDLLKSYSTKFAIVLGTDDIANKYVVYGGKYYRWIIQSSDNFLDYEILN
jgi:hypothetical protein